MLANRPKLLLLQIFWSSSEPLSSPGSVPQPGDGVVEEEGLDEDEEVDHDPGHGHHTVTGHDAVTCHVCELVPHDTDHATSDTGHH